MPMTRDVERVRERAHALWEQAGRPDGQHDAHWLQAERELEEGTVTDEVSLNPGDAAPPGTPGTGEDACPVCGGTGKVGAEPCENCGGTGLVVEGVGGG